jgi:hypothetical protein
MNDGTGSISSSRRHIVIGNVVANVKVDLGGNLGWGFLVGWFIALALHHERERNFG